MSADSGIFVGIVDYGDYCTYFNTYLISVMGIVYPLRYVLVMFYSSFSIVSIR
jgi:hypothetical protein